MLCNCYSDVTSEVDHRGCQWMTKISRLLFASDCSYARTTDSEIWYFKKKKNANSESSSLTLREEDGSDLKAQRLITSTNKVNN